MPRHPATLLLALLTLTVACGDADPDDTGADDTGDTDTDSPVEDRVTETGDCHPQDTLAAATPLASEPVGVTSEFFDVFNAVPAVISSETELAAFETTIGTTIDTVIDFDVQVLLFSAVDTGSTCGADDPVVHVVAIDGAPHLSLELTNPGVLCGDVCDMAYVASRMVVVDKVEGASATVCGRLVETCEG